MSAVTVRHVSGDRFSIAVREHELVVDQPVAQGGEDTAPTPTELLVASLAACVAFYARRHLARHDLPAEGLEVTADFRTDARPSRVSAMHVVVRPPRGFPAERRAALLAVASRCTVHNTLTSAPEITVELE